MTKKKREAPMGVRLTPANKVLFADLHKRLKMDNKNLTWNLIVRRYCEYERNKELLQVFAVLDRRYKARTD